MFRECRASSPVSSRLSAHSSLNRDGLLQRPEYLLGNAVVDESATHARQPMHDFNIRFARIESAVATCGQIYAQLFFRVLAGPHMVLRSCEPRN